ncbi:MAG TPA: PDZ domain-containing protein [Pyrinomonadaceae bacterium]
MSKLLATLVVSLVFSFSVFAQTQNAPLLIGRVAANQNQIAFVYAGKIWTVERAGGAAKILHDIPNEEGFPVFSPDGRRLAFSRHNGNDWDIYVSDANGSNEKRVTIMPEHDFLVAWTPDGKDVIFETTRDEESVSRLYKILVDNPTLAAPLPLPQANHGSFSPDGKQLAYNPRTPFFEWRYYRGGLAAPIWIADLQTGVIEKLPNQNYNDRFPMWLGDKIYFISDRTGTFNLFAYDRKTKQPKQLTKFDTRGIRSASAASDAVVFVQDGRIHLFDLTANQDRVVNVSVTPDTSELRPRATQAMRFLESVLPSANGEKLIFGVRGEVLVFDAASNEAKNLTNTSGAAERYPMVSPDNKSVAYFSDEAGEYALHVRSLENNSVKKIQIEPKPSFYWELVWSPDSKKVAFADRRLNLWLADVASGTAAKIDNSEYAGQMNWRPAFSPDSRFLTYSKRLKNRAGTIFVYDSTAKKSFQITDGVTHTESPVFDQNGKYLYFVSSPNANTSDLSWVLSPILSRPLVVRRIHAAILAKNGASLLLPNNQPNPEAKVSEAAGAVQIDFENIGKRIINLPLPQKDYARLIAGTPGKLFVEQSEWGDTPGAFDSQTASAVYLFDTAKMARPEKIVEEIGNFDITSDGKRIMFQKGRDWFLTSAEKAPAADEGKLNLSKMEVRVEPAAEWRQIFSESKRIMRDWFYDPNHHGQNLDALEREYAAYLPTITRRTDLNRLMQMMLGSVSISHLGVGGGDAPPPQGLQGNRIGLLGADYAIENGRYRFKKIYRSTAYSSVNGSFSAPLDQPGVDVREGDYLLEVNGNKVESGKNVLSYLENAVGKPTKLTVSANPDGSGARTYTVYPAAGENRLRRANWAENNRQLVEKMSGGKLGYIFIENYDPDGISNAIRGLTGYSDKAGIIVDQRFNSGGITPDYLIEWLARKPLYYYAFRGGNDVATPVNPAPPVKVMLIIEMNGSAAETGAFMFQLGKVGKIVGKRTSGGGIGPYFFTPRLVDGGRIQLPNRAAFNPDGTSWGIENVGVSPDFDVETTPQDFMAGRDAQLEKAVEVALGEIAKTKIPLPKHPVFPVHPGAETVGASGAFNLPVPGSAFPLTEAKPETKSAAPITAANPKFSDYIGSYNSTIGPLVVRQEGDKLIADAGNEKVELAPENQPDKFTAQPHGSAVAFVRDASGKVTEIVVLMGGNREIRGKRVN